MVCMYVLINGDRSNPMIFHYKAAELDLNF